MHSPNTVSPVKTGVQMFFSQWIPASAGMTKKCVRGLIASHQVFNIFFERGVVKKKIKLIGVPLDIGQTHRGVDMGPSAVRYAGLRGPAGKTRA